MKIMRLDGSQCSLKNAPPAGDFHWFMLQKKSRLLHFYHPFFSGLWYHLDVLQKYLQEKQQLRLVADSSSCVDGLVLAH